MRTTTRKALQDRIAKVAAHERCAERVILRDEIQHETLHQQGILDHILAKAAAGSDEEGDRVPAAATPDHNAINQRGEQGMLQLDLLVGLC